MNRPVNAKTQRVQCDARAVPAELAQLLKPETELWVQNAAFVALADAQRLATLTQDAHVPLFAVVRIEHARRLGLTAWRSALQPSVLVLRSTRPIDWPALESLVGRLAAMGLSWRLQLAVGLTNLNDLAVEKWHALAVAAGTTAIAATIEPALGQDAPPLREFAGRLAALALTPHDVRVTRLVPSCAVPRSLPIEPVFPSVLRAANVARAPGCADCAQAKAEHCPGIAADLLARAPVPFGPDTAGALDATGAKASAVASAGEAVETTALLLGLRDAWRLDATIADAQTLARDAVTWFPFQGNGLTAHLGLQFREHASGWFDCTSATPERQLVYFAREHATAELADRLEREMAARQASAMVEQQGDASQPASDNLDEQLGACFGYPTCCIASVVNGHRLWMEGQEAAVAETAWFALTAARASTRWDWRLDPTTPLQDSVWIRHYPCRWDCDASLALVAQLEAHQPWRAQKAVDQRPDATLLWADGTALPLRGERVNDTTLLHPQPFAPAAPSQRAEKTRRVADALRDLLANTVRLEATFPPNGPGGVHLLDKKGDVQTLEWPDGGTHPDFPRLIVFSPSV